MLSKEKLKRNLWLLTLLVLLSFKSFSQNDTVNQKIVLTKPVAKLVVKDLIQGDQTKEELVATNDILVKNFLEGKINYNDILSKMNKILKTSEIYKLKKILPRHVSEVISTNEYILSKINSSKI